MTTKGTNWFNILSNKPGVVYNVPITHYDDAIGAVPPIYCPPVGGVRVTAMGEAFSHDPVSGKPTYYCYTTHADEVYGVVSTLNDAAVLFAEYLNTYVLKD